MALKKVFSLTMLCLALVGCAAPRRAQAQFLGYVSSQSVAQSAFASQSANGATSTFQNIGQSSHFLSYCNTGFAGTISLEASTDGTFASPIPLASATYGQGSTIDGVCHVLQAGGYFQAVRARVSNYVSGSTTAFYTAVGSPVTFAPSALGSNGPTAPIACDKVASGSVSSGSTGTLLIPSLAGTQIYICAMTISFNGAITAANLTLTPSTGGACGALGGGIWVLTLTANTPQMLNFGSGLGAFTRTTAAQTLASPTVCATAGAMTATALISLSYAQF